MRAHTNTHAHMHDCRNFNELLRGASAARSSSLSNKVSPLPLQAAMKGRRESTLSGACSLQPASTTPSPFATVQGLAPEPSLPSFPAPPFLHGAVCVCVCLGVCVRVGGCSIVAVSCMASKSSQDHDQECAQHDALHAMLTAREIHTCIPIHSLRLRPARQASYALKRTNRPALCTINNS